MSTVTEINPRLLALTEAGVSVWLDQIRRSLVEGGELARMIAEECLRGMTANPSIFEKAILGSTDYDEELERARARAARRDRDLRAARGARRAACSRRAAATCIAHPADATGSSRWRCSPDLAHDTERTLAEVRAYWQRLERPNVMIKIPGTPEGVPAIEQALYEGINVNVTLLFAVAAYEAVAEAYIRALERRHDGGPATGRQLGRVVLRLAVDTNVDRRLAELGRADLHGKAAIANARARLPAVQGDLLGGPRWEALRARRRRGAAPAVGLDQHEGPALPGHDVRRGARRRAHGQHDAAADAAGRRRPRGVSGSAHPTAEQDPGPELAALAAGGDRHGSGHRRAAGRRRQAVRGRARTGCSTGSTSDAPRSSPAGHRRSGRSCLRDRGAQSPSASGVRSRRRWPSASGAGTPTLWGGPGVAEIEDRLGWLTVSETMLEHAARAARVRRPGAGPMASPMRSCSGWAARRSVPR